jgi:hypothetical protein
MDIHDEIGHFGERRILVEVKSQYFWHNMTKFIKEVIHICKKFQLVKRTRNVKLELIWLVHSWSNFDAQTNHGQTRIHKTHHSLDLEEATTFPLIVFFVLGHEIIIQMSFCPRTPKQ